ncbi:PKD domain-containing protein [Candidatus Acetothermia bacterium]|nr:PKD domain-containing protein [Candidatus Acetothermia bacterium]
MNSHRKILCGVLLLASMVSLLSGCSLMSIFGSPFFIITGFTGPISVDVGQSAIYNVSIENTGQQAGTGNLVVKVAGEERFHGSYTLKPNESKTFDVTLTFSSPGSVDLKAETPNSSRGLGVTVRSLQPQPPHADFTASPTSGTAPLTVYFTNRTTGSYTSLMWQFGDGMTSGETNPAHTYSRSGNYIVQLTAHGPGGDDTARGTISVSEPLVQPPHADFTASPTSGTVPLTVYFANRTTGSYTSLFWEFGDGATSNETNPVHTYSSTGYYTVQLTARGPGGASAATALIYVNAAPPPPSYGTFTGHNFVGEGKWAYWKLMLTAGEFHLDSATFVRSDGKDDKGEAWLLTNEDYDNWTHDRSVYNILTRGYHLTNLPAGTYYFLVYNRSDYDFVEDKLEYAVTGRYR